MGTSSIQNGPLHLENEALEIFGCRGMRQGNNWLMNLLGGGVYVEVAPQHARPQIEAIIEEDCAANKGEQIHYVEVDPNTALRLYLDGTISRRRVMQAHVEPERVIFADITFNAAGRTWTLNVVVNPNAAVKIATKDSKGCVV